MSLWRWPRRGKITSATALLILALAIPAPTIASEVLILRSGNGTIGSPDGVIHYLAGAAGTAISPVAFTPADFAAACAGPSPIVVVASPAWIAKLPSDPTAQWVALNSSLTPASTLLCHPFTVTTAAICSASISFIVAADDRIGDPLPDPNTAGVYLNHQPLTAFAGANFKSETIYSDPAIAPLLVAGANQLHVYSRDIGFSIAGTVYAATITIDGYATADAGLDASVCQGAKATLDGAASTAPTCTGGLEYQWSEGGVPLGPWSASPTWSVSPAATTTYELEVRCLDAPTCTTRDSVTIPVYPLPVANAGPDQAGCSERDYTLSGSATSLPPCTPLEYRWSAGGTPIGPWSPSPGATVLVTVDTTYTLETRCAALPGCVSSDAVLVDVKTCTTAVAYGLFEVTRVSSGARLRWTTLVEAGSVGFAVWVRDEAGTEAELPGLVYATGSGSAYEFFDTRTAARSGQRLRYRVVEQTVDGAGDATEWMALGDAGGNRGRHRGGQRP